MKERPILFSTQMVQAILAGNKTQTRRILKYPINGFHDYQFEGVSFLYGAQALFAASAEGMTTQTAVACPYGQVGDQLWVREAWSLNFYGGHTRSDGGNREIFEQYAVEYKAFGDPLIIDRNYHDEKLCALYDNQRGNFRPSIHMPRWASRIQLGIINIRVERLNDISEQDAKAEGVISLRDEGVFWLDYSNPDGKGVNSLTKSTAIESYQTLWESINGAGSWDANPWVWVVEFTTISLTGKAPS